VHFWLYAFSSDGAIAAASTATCLATISVLFPWQDAESTDKQSFPLQAEATVVLPESNGAAKTPLSRELSHSSLNAETFSVGSISAGFSTGRSGRQDAAWKRKGQMEQTTPSVASAESPGTRSVLDMMDEHFTGAATV
jgi:hypothetical protein